MYLQKSEHLRVQVRATAMTYYLFFHRPDEVFAIEAKHR
jgi:hypothetical protein